MNRLISPIAHIQSVFPDKFGIPRQSGLVQGLQSQIIFEKPYQNMNALRGLEDFSHLWLIWTFSKNPNITEKNWSPTVRPPRLGGNKRIGVFATRSSFRPNGLALSSVRLEAICADPKLGPVITVSGADLMDGTPIYDIKPYISTDCHPDAVCGFQEHTRNHQIDVHIPASLLAVIPKELQQGLLDVLAQDPRPSYQNLPERIYGICFDRFNIRFQAADQKLSVLSIEPIHHSEKQG